MSMWVAPSVAAEIWGVSIDQILDGIANGSIQSQVDGQFLFVDVDRGGYSKSTPRAAPPAPLVNDQELAALTSEPIEPSSVPLPPPEEMLQVTEEDFNDVSHWRVAREQTSRLRRPPQSQAA